MKYWNTRLYFLYTSNHLIRLIHTHTHTQTDSGGREDITEKKRKTGGIKKKEKENVRQYSLSF